MCTRWLSQRTLFDLWTVHIVARQDRPCCQRQYEKVRHMETFMEERPWRGALKRHAVLNGPASLHNVFAPGPQSGSSDISIDVQVLVLWTILGELGISGATLNDILDIPYISKIFQSLLVTLVISYIFFEKKAGTVHWSNNNRYADWSAMFRPYYMPNSGDIETTAYALLAISLDKDVVNGLPVVRWLSQQRNSLGGYSSTQVQGSRTYNTTIPI